MDIFRKTCLNARENKIFKMLLDGYTVAEILYKHNMAQRELDKLCKSIGKRWEDFNQLCNAG